MKKPVIYSGVLESFGPFDVYVGARTEEDFPVYVVINRTTEVVEFSHEILQVTLEWAEHFAGKLQERKPKPVQNVIEFPTPAEKVN